MSERNVRSLYMQCKQLGKRVFLYLQFLNVIEDEQSK